MKKLNEKKMELVAEEITKKFSLESNNDFMTALKELKETFKFFYHIGAKPNKSFADVLTELAEAIERKNKSIDNKVV